MTETPKPDDALVEWLRTFLDAPEAVTFTIVKDGDQLLLNVWTVDLRAKQFEEGHRHRAGDDLLRECWRYLDVAAGEGEVRNGVDAADLYRAIDAHLSEQDNA